MDKNYQKNSNSSDNLPILRSASKETKYRFDSLLKTALNNNDKVHNDAQNLDSTKLNSEEVHEFKIVDWAHRNENNDKNKENYILKKFLLDAANVKQEDKTFNHDLLPNAINFIKPPVPLPRHIKLNPDDDLSSSSSSYKTYSISPSKVIPPEFKDIERLSICTTSTYNVEPKKIKSKATNTRTIINDDNICETICPIDNVDKKVETKNKKQSKEVVEEKNIEIPIGDIVLHNIQTAKKKSYLKVIHQNSKLYNAVSSIDEESRTNLSFSETASQQISSHGDDIYVEQSSTKRFNKSRKKTSTKGSPKSIKSNDIELENYSNKSRISQLKNNKLQVSRNTGEDSINSWQQSKIYTYEDLIGIIIYKSDKLLFNSFINHPCVKVHIVDAVTGEYLKRSRHIEEHQSVTKYIYPLITKAYDLKTKKSLVPNWNELLTIEEDFEYILDYKNSIIIFFEILDFLTFSDASLKYRTEGPSSGWHRMAWAFLKPIGNKGHLNVEQKLRLQLYKPKKLFIKKTSKACILYDWWASGNLVKYPSSLHICVKKVKKLASSKEDDITSEKLLFDTLADKEIDHNLDNTIGDTINIANSININNRTKWSRKNSQPCKIPNRILSQIKSADKGCFIMKFSNNGLLIACGIATLTKYPLVLYSVLQSSIHCKFTGHLGLIYDLCWSSDDKYLISASADCSVYIWNVLNMSYHPKQVLPHPTFVYCAFLKISVLGTEIITGCYDKVLRIWKASNNVVDSNYELLKEIDGHIGYITCICSKINENTFYSSDSLGLIIEWTIENEEWQLKRKFQFKEYQNTVINYIIMHPIACKLILFCRDSTIRMLDLAVGCISQWYRGALNYRFYMRGCITPCGNFIFAPSEDGSVCIWNTDTGILKATYNPYSSMAKETVVPYCVQYHPYDHILIICHYGSLIPILLCSFHARYTGRELQFKDCSKINVKKPIPECLKTCKKTKLGVKAGKHNEEQMNFISKTATFDVIMEKIEEVLENAKME